MEIVEKVEFLWLVGGLVATLLVGAFVISWIERWRKRQLVQTPADEITQLGHFRALYERGELTKEEYDRIKAKEAKRLRDKLIGKAKPAKPVPPSSDEPMTGTTPPEPDPPPPTAP